jgi:hypothetical protein
MLRRTPLHAGWQRLVPLVISAALIVWVFAQVPLTAVLAGAARLRWQLLIPVTAAMVLGLYLWDGLCLKAVYSTGRVPLGYLTSLRVRGVAYLFSSLNCQLGNLVVVWNMARLQRASFIAMLSRGILLMYHDGLVLMTTGLVGALVSSDPRAPRIRWVCGTALGLLAALAVVLPLLPSRQRRRFCRSRWGGWLGSWTWGRSVRLVLLRVAYYAILVLYATAALRIAEIHVDQATLFGTIPLVLVADQIPSISGLGAREKALLLLLQPEDPAILAAVGLIWSCGLIFGRLALGLVHVGLGGSILIEPHGTRSLQRSP